MKKVFKIVWIVLCTSYSSLLFAQTTNPTNQSHYNNWLIEKDKMPVQNIHRIKKAFDKAWDGKSYEKGKGWKQYKRWEHAVQRRTDQDGNLVNPYQYAHEYEDFLQRSSPAGDSTGNWSPLGPSNWVTTSSGYNPGIGRVNAITADPSNPNILFAAAASGGIWKSEDAGNSWTTTTDDLAVLGTSDIAIDPTNSDIIYIATGDRDGLDTYGIGVLISKDGGATWSNTGLSYATANVDYVVNKLLHHPTQSGVVIAATKDGIYKTTDTGATWVKSSSLDIKDLEYQPGNPNVVYACNTGFYKSTDGGDSFTQISSGMPPSVGRMVCGVTPADSNYIYLLVANVQNEFYGVLRSTDAGNTFTVQMSYDTLNLLGYAFDGLDNSSQAWYDLAIAVSPTNAEEVYTGGVNVWKSLDGGVNWDISSHWYYVNDPDIYSHADIHSLDFYDDELYCGSDGGVFKKDTLDVWSDLSTGLNIAQIYKMSNSATEPNYLSTGHQDNGTNYFKDGTWNHVLGADGMETVIDPYSEDLIYVSSQNGNFSKSTDGGESFSGIFSPGTYGDDGGWVTPFVMSPSNNLNLYVACRDVYKSTNAGNTWAPISDDLYQNSLSTLNVASSDENYIYVTYSRLIYVTKDGGVNWNPVVLNFNTGDITDLEIDINDPEKIYVTCAGYNDTLKVFMSEDGGDNFTNISKNLPNIPATTLILDNEFPGAIYVGMELGIYYTDSSLDEWIPYQENMPHVEISELEIQYSSRKLRAATYGRGVWESPLFPTVISTGYKELNDQFTLYPNPTQGTINIQLNSKLKKGSNISIHVLNVAGIQVKKYDFDSISKKSTLDLGDLSKGVYFIKIIGEDFEKVEKVILTD